MAECWSCKAPITFALTATGKKMPLDAEPVDDGEYVIDYDDEGAPHTFHQPVPDLMGTPRYKPHWATCPHAKQHRKEAP